VSRACRVMCGVCCVSYLLHGLVPVEVRVAQHEPTLAPLLLHPSVLVILRRGACRVVSCRVVSCRVVSCRVVSCRGSRRGSRRGSCRVSYERLRGQCQRERKKSDERKGTSGRMSGRAEYGDPSSHTEVALVVVVVQQKSANSCVRLCACGACARVWSGACSVCGACGRARAVCAVVRVR
jgi:hypothetical protein